ncbi:MAG TPA: NAD(P)/FAD-dependent oxidoreductase [Myxococcaceae bacterium]|nr:NAD(P)/FAD-dependent oxidoreductase [Myxococcaceae bacterium]
MAGRTIRFDAIVVGGGPAGSACARVLVQGGLRVLVLERRRFPRVKLCAGWLSPPVWEVLELARDVYPGGLWPWRRCHVRYQGRTYRIVARGDFIRRLEFDDFLLRRSGASVVDGHLVASLERGDGGWLVDGTYAAPVLVGAGGTHCPVARKLFPGRPGRPVAVQEREFEADPAEVAATRVGADGEPELLLHDDLGGYSWNVPKGCWLNVGTGAAAATRVRSAWAKARDRFLDSGHLPASAREALCHVEGHTYHLFDPAHLDACHRNGAFLVGDSLGLAHPLTAEGILPAVLSGRVCGEAILDGAGQSYGARLALHPTFRDYALTRELLRAIVARRSARSLPPRRPGRLARSATARGFAWMLGGRPLPAGWLLGAALRIGGGRAA